MKEVPIFDRMELLTNVILHIAKQTQPHGLVPRDPAERERFVADIAERYLQPKEGWTEAQLVQWEMEKADVRDELSLAALSVVNQQDCGLLN